MNCWIQGLGGRGRLALLALLAALTIISTTAGPARAATTQEAWLQADTNMLSNPLGTLQQLRVIGVDRVRMSVRWQQIAPQPNSYRAPRHFDATNPAAYPAANWAPFDNIVKAAQATGVALDFNVVGGAPLWATGPNSPGGRLAYEWEPIAADYQAFVQALGTRYSGSYNPVKKRLVPGNGQDLPRVSFWTVWNEPNYGPGLSPQGLPGNLSVEHAPAMYRGLVDAAWSGLRRTGHGSDTVVIGEVTPRGLPNPQSPKKSWGLFQGMTPLNFVRNLYCVDARYRPLRGQAARLRGCPTNAAGSARFRSQNPVLFQASGFSVHPYSRYYSPNIELYNDPDYASLADIQNLERSLDRVNRVYGSNTKFPIWNTEYAYMTSPPKPHFDPYDSPPSYYVSQNVAAQYINYAEYISYENPRIMSYMQYLLDDPLPRLKSNNFGGYASGLIAYGGTPKATYYAYQLPLYLPKTTATAGHALEVWGAIRPAHYAMLDNPVDPEVAVIQFTPGSGQPYHDVAVLPVTNPNGYFDTHIVFPSSGSVRLVYTYPSGDLRLLPGTTAVSRTVQITVQ